MSKNAQTLTHNGLTMSNLIVWQPYCVEVAINGVYVKLTRSADDSTYHVSCASSRAGDDDCLYDFGSYTYSQEISRKATPAAIKRMWNIAYSVCEGLKGDAYQKAEKNLLMIIADLGWDSELGALFEKLRDECKARCDEANARERVIALRKAIERHTRAMKRDRKHGGAKYFWRAVAHVHGDDLLYSSYSATSDKKAIEKLVLRAAKSDGFEVAHVDVGVWPVKQVLAEAKTSVASLVSLYPAFRDII